MIQNQLVNRIFDWLHHSTGEHFSTNDHSTQKFGEMLISRPAGQEAYLAAQAYTLPKQDEPIIIDFGGPWFCHLPGPTSF